jgi:hypothetical protein
MFLSGCVNIDTVQDNFFDKGYTKSEDASEFIGNVLNSFDEDVTVESYVYTKDAKVAVILVFEGNEELDTELEENNTLQGVIEDLEEERLVRNNMLLIPIGLSDEAVEDIITTFNE